MNRIDRIKEMEAHFDNATEAVQELSIALEKYAEAKDSIKTLTQYYTSPLWIEDYEADEEGLLPAGLKRGVLSQDAVYNLLCENGGLLEELKKVLTQI